MLVCLIFAPMNMFSETRKLLKKWLVYLRGFMFWMNFWYSSSLSQEEYFASSSANAASWKETEFHQLIRKEHDEIETVRVRWNPSIHQTKDSKKVKLKREPFPRRETEPKWQTRNQWEYRCNRWWISPLGPHALRVPRAGAHVHGEVVDKDVGNEVVPAELTICGSALTYRTLICGYWPLTGKKLYLNTRKKFKL